MVVIKTEYLTRTQSAEWLTESGYPITASYLGKLAHTGDSPIYQIFGNKALYRPEDLQSWARGRISKPLENTAQRGL